MLAGSASAAPVPGCNGDEQAGAHGKYCVDHDGTDVGGLIHLGVRLPVHVGANVNVPSCPDATAALVEAHVIVGGTNGKAGTSRRLADAEAANAAAVKNLDVIAKQYYPVRDAATTATDALTKYDATHGAAPLPPVVPADRDALVRARDDAAATLRTVGQQFFDATSAVYGPNGTKANLETCRKAEGTAEQGVVDAEVVIGQACKTQPVPPPAAAPPAPEAPPEQGPSVIIYPGTPGQPPTADSQTVVTHLPVTG
jgi:hypothetical protein